MGRKRMKPKVFVTCRLPDAAMANLESFCDAEVWNQKTPPSREVLLEKVKDAEGLLCLLTDRIDAEVLNHGPKLRVISNCAVGFDNVDVVEATRRGIVVGNTPGVLTETTADLAFALMLAAARRVVEGDRFVRAGKWKTWSPTLLLGQDVHGATLGIVGLGRIGVAVAKRAQGFGMRILYHNRTRNPAAEEQLGAQYVDLVTLLTEADFVTLHTNLTPETFHLIGRDQLRQMKKTAILVNTARGQIVDTLALYEALRDGTIAYAALDVTDPEPLPAGHPLLRLENVIIVPHIASASVATRTNMVLMAVDNLAAGLKGEMPPNPVNPEALQRYRCS